MVVVCIWKLVFLMAALAAVGRRRFVSVSALSEILKEIKALGMPDATSRGAIKRARDAEFAEKADTPHGKVLIQMEIGNNADGSPVLAWIAEPRACLYYFIRTCTKLESFIATRIQLHPNSMDDPWTVILYNDEVVSGNPLKHDNHRKIQAYYWSFLEFGKEALCSEFLWFTITAVRSDIVKAMSGLGAGQLSKHMILAFADMAITGFQCGEIILWARLEKFVSDEAACKSTFDVKGASGVLPCFWCKNVLKKLSFENLKNKAGMVTVSELDTSQFKRHDDNTIVANAKWLHAQKTILGVGKFKEAEVSLGLVYAPQGVLLNTDFPAISGFCWDYQHVYFVHGIFNVEVGLLLALLKSTPVNGSRIKHTDIHTFFQGFKWPFFSKAGDSVFEKRASDAGDTPLQCSASEGLGCFALLQEFLCLRVFPYASKIVKAACVSFYALCVVITALTMTARGTVSATMLHNVIIKHLSCFKAAYGDEAFTPKFHYATHLAEQLALMKMLIACFTHERKHKELKRYIQGRTNTSDTWERNILQDVLYIQHCALQEDFPYPKGVCLHGARKAPAVMAKTVQEIAQVNADVYTAIAGKASCFTSVHVNDVVYVDWGTDQPAVAQVIFLSRVADTCLACVRLWTKMPQHNMYNTAGDEYLVPLASVVDTCIYSLKGQIAFVVPPRGAM